MNKWNRLRYIPNLPLGKDGSRVTACKEHIQLSKEAAKEGMVLLKNENNVLPLAKGSKVALFGKAAIDYVKGGGGSGDVTVSYIKNLAEGLAELSDIVSVFPDTVAFYKKEVEEQYKKGYLPGMTIEPEIPEELLGKAAEYTDTAIISICRFSGENWDRKSDFDPIKEHEGVDTLPIQLSNEIFEDGDFYLSHAEKAMVEKVISRFEKVILVLNTGGMIDCGWFADNEKISSVLLAWQGGMEGGSAAAELLMGKGTPSGKLSDTFARNLTDYPSSIDFYESDEYVDYTEDIYVGYRYFETVPGAAEKVIYPFGYGLSYTAFTLQITEFVIGEEEVNVTVSVCNTGNCPGKEVVQVYYSAPQGLLGKPAKELAGYQKTKLLEPGEEQTVTIRFSINSMASYDDLGKVCKSAYLLEKGTYRFYVGTSVRQVQEAETVYVIEEDRVTEQLKPEMVPTSLAKRMRSDGTYEELPQTECHDPWENVLQPMAEEDMSFPAPDVRYVEGKQFYKAEPGVKKLLAVADGEITLDEFMAQLSDEDLIWLCGGQPCTGVANTFGFGNNERFGIPNVMTADGPAGLRIWPEIGVNTTAFPCATLLACTWNTELAEQIGIAGGKEVKENNIGVWLTPAICIHRNPLCGRNFEYYSEDPLLTAKQAGAMVRGIQSNGIAASVKHFALNNKESNRKNSDSRCSERAIREIYLKAFEIIVKEADPWTIMSSYNIINGHRASENHDLLTDILRGEWHYKGMVTSDWWTHGENYKEVKAGNDVKMGRGYPKRMAEAMGLGVLKREDMEIAVRRVLEMILKLD